MMQTLKGSQNYIWSLTEILGQGATGAVYKARHKKTGELYAVKWFNEQSQLRPLQVQMREFEVLKKLKHPNIVNLLAIEEETQSHQKVLVMELCTEGSLYNILDDPEHAYGLPEEEFFNVLRDVSAGMKHLRDCGIIHRDIKPGNIMKYVGDDGRAVYKLIDFGAARELQDDENFMSLYGTEEYLHPDLYERAVLRRPMGKQFGINVDLWSLGVTFYHVATGQLPFRPYGGRQNKETMYKITAEKQSGVISGTQRTEHGPIIWSRELPGECILSHGARILIVPLLAGLMECNPALMWNFDTYFEHTNSVLRKIFINVFHLGTSRLLHVYIDPEEKLSKFQELIAEQVNVPAAKQYLVYENIPLSEFVDPYEEVRNYPDTSSSTPIFLFDTDVAVTNKLVYPPIGEMPRIQLMIDLDEDVQLGKTCAGILCYMKRTLTSTLLKQELIYRAAKMYLVVLMRKLLQHQAFITQFEGHLQEVDKRIQAFQQSHDLSMKVVQLLNRHLDSPSIISDKFSELTLLSSSNKEQFDQVSRKAVAVRSTVQQYCHKVISRKELNTHWKKKEGCKPEERCADKMDILAKHVKATLSDFKKNRKLKRLSYNEEQIHKFEKSKLIIHMSEAVSLLQTHCFAKLDTVFIKFMEWFRPASDIHKTVDNLENDMTSLVQQQTTFCEILDTAQKKHHNRFTDLLTQLEETSIGWIKYPPVATTPLPAQESNGYVTTPKSTSRKAEKVRTLHSELNVLERETHSIRQLLEENTSMLENMEQSLSVTNSFPYGPQ